MSHAGEVGTTRAAFGLRRVRPTQEAIVLLVALALFAGFAALVPGFLQPGNLIALVRAVSVLGILAIGMGVVVIGRGIDLSAVAVMALSVAWMLALLNDGWSLPAAAGLALGAVVLVGVLNGVLIAYAEVPPIFTTLAMAAFVYGFGRSVLITQDLITLPEDETVLRGIGALHWGPVPVEIVLFAVIGVLAALMLRFTRFGRFTYLMGDNPIAARSMGLPVRPMVVGQYVLSAVIAFLAGAVTAANLLSMNTRIVNSQLLYDIILVVVIGGIGLSGGRGGVRNVVVGTLLIGILSNGMTILDVPDLYQKLVKALVLLAAIIIDSLLNPRDEQTDTQGDI